MPSKGEIHEKNIVLGLVILGACSKNSEGSSDAPNSSNGGPTKQSVKVLTAKLKSQSKPIESILATEAMGYAQIFFFSAKGINCDSLNSSAGQDFFSITFPTQLTEFAGNKIAESVVKQIAPMFPPAVPAQKLNYKFEFRGNTAINGTIEAVSNEGHSLEGPFEATLCYK